MWILKHRKKIPKQNSSLKDKTQEKLISVNSVSGTQHNPGQAAGVLAGHASSIIKWCWETLQHHHSLLASFQRQVMGFAPGCRLRPSHAMEEPRKEELALSMASCPPWQMTRSSSQVLLQLALPLPGEMAKNRSCSGHLPPARTQAGCGPSRRVGQALLPGEGGSKGASKGPLGSPRRSPKSALRLLNPTLLPTPRAHSLHNNHASCLPKCHKISLLPTHIGTARPRTGFGLTWRWGSGLWSVPGWADAPRL